MDWFLVKKSFFDAWDNLLGLTLLNVGYMAMIAAAILIGGKLEGAEDLTQMGLLALMLLVLCLYSIGVNSTVHNYSQYKSGLFVDFLNGIRQKISHLPLLLGLDLLAIAIPFIGVPYYLGSAIPGAVLICGILVFFEFYLILSLQFFCPLAFTFPEDSPVETLKKAFRIAGDNFWFSILMIFLTAIKLVLSLMTLFFLPGIAGIFLFQNNALKLILIRNKWMQENDIYKKNKIDYKDMLESERECVGHRTLKDLLFPWKNTTNKKV